MTRQLLGPQVQGSSYHPQHQEDSRDSKGPGTQELKGQALQHPEEGAPCCPGKTGPRPSSSLLPTSPCSPPLAGHRDEVVAERQPSIPEQSRQRGIWSTRMRCEHPETRGGGEGGGKRGSAGMLGPGTGGSSGRAGGGPQRALKVQQRGPVGSGRGV